MQVILIIVGGLLFLWSLIYKPQFVLILFFTLTIARLNLSLPGFTINVRPIICLLLIARSFFKSKEELAFSSFFSIPLLRMVMIFFAYLYLISWGKDTLNGEVSNFLLLSILTAYLGYYSYTLRGDILLIKVALIVSGLICFLDLGYTYIYFGNFPVRRLFDIFVEDTNNIQNLQDNNWNFFGFICGLCFTLILSDFMNDKLAHRLTLLLLPVMFLGVLMSTSRSSLLGVFISIMFVVLSGLRNVRKSKKSTQIILAALMMIVLSFFIFLSIQTVFDLDFEFVQRISYRLIEEPLAVFKKNMGYSYNVQNLEAMDWRAESASIAFNVYTNLPIPEQLFGVGIGGYLQRNLGHNGLNPHNGILYILLESGFVGLCMYIIIFWRILLQAMRLGYYSSILLVLVFICFYALGQNEELISAATCLFIVAIIAENHQVKFARPPVGLVAVK